MPVNRSHLINWQSPIDWSHPLARGLVFWWLPVGSRIYGPNTYDFVGGRRGVLTGFTSTNTSWKNGFVPRQFTRAGGSLLFDGVSDYVRMDSDVGVVSGLSEGTISAWFQTSDSGVSAILAASDASDPSSDGLVAIVSQKIFIQFRENGTNTIELNSSLNYDDGLWHHVAYTTNASGNVLYIDGVPDSGSYVTGNSGTQAFYAGVNDLDTFRLGNNQDNGGNQWFFPGHLTDIRIYNRVLKAAEVAVIASGKGFPWRYVTPRSLVSSVAATSSAGDLLLLGVGA